MVTIIIASIIIVLLGRFISYKIGFFSNWYALGIIVTCVGGVSLFICVVFLIFKGYSVIVVNECVVL